MNIIVHHVALPFIAEFVALDIRWRIKRHYVAGIKSIPYDIISRPFIERLIGAIRPEYLHRVLFSNAIDIEKTEYTHRLLRQFP